jgi:hypothetical protein
VKEDNRSKEAAMRSVNWFSSVALAGVCAAIAIATPALGADLYTEPAPSYGYQPPPPPPAYGPPPYVQQGYVPAPYYRPYRPVYRPYAWGAPYGYYGYPRRYVEVAPRPPAPIVGAPGRAWGAYPQYDEDIAQAAPPAYGYPPQQRW